MVEQLTLYTSDLSPFSHKVEIALDEAGISAQVIRFHIPLHVTGDDKPAWFSEKVNPLGTVPAIAYGSQPSPEQPSSESVKILESLVIVEFIADLYPNAKLVPSNPVLRARARAVAAASNNAIMAAWKEAFGNNNVESILTALDQIQSLLSDGATYAVGDEFTIADISIGPWLGRLEMLLENDFFEKFEKTIVGKVHEVYKSQKYDKLREYNRRVQERPSVKNTYRKDVALQYYRQKLSPKQ